MEPSKEAREVAFAAATQETARLSREMNITNADHIALWIEANTIPDEPMNQCASWLACRIVEAHERAIQQYGDQRVAEAEARIVELEAALDAAWKFGTQMRNASKLVGPYENDPRATKIWQRSLYHQGKDLHALLKPYRHTTAQSKEIG